MAAPRIVPLEPHEADAAYALARLGYPELSLAGWRRLARRILRSRPGRSGALTARDGAGRLNGMLIYAVDPALNGPPTLRIEKLIAFDMMDACPVAEALVAQALTLGRAQGCDAIAVRRPLSPSAETTALIVESGAGALHRIL